MGADLVIGVHRDEIMPLWRSYTENLQLLPNNMAFHSPFAPLSKEDVADVFGVTPRTIENWVEHEGMPAPACIGNRVFWHPDVFYEWLDQRLRVTKADLSGTATVDISPKRRLTGSAESDQLRSRNLQRVASIEAGASPV